ncbi:hypothetical protein VTJ83DRAFT_5007 [Remersonia thermophila]|uniref:tRNA nucleotidyltransferase n=1 Tax=Remersonia thermophila TaxID=72144 RepID=A0ABR4DBK3_9PEZI
MAAPPPSSSSAPAPLTLRLTPLEQQLRDLLVSVAKFIDEQDLGDAASAAAAAAAPPAEGGSSSSSSTTTTTTTDATPARRDPVVLRWAGGWVRDKLLGIESHDIDTAINVMTGEAFVDRLREYADVPEHQRRHGIGPDDIGRLHKVARNPDKSKHLETSTIRLCGLDVDFVNLRKETYTEESRNPLVEFGTAEEDALRRDATVNALFYNLNTGLVEDFVGGVEDLGNKVLRTPMEPLQTFLDDPLRVLRLVRFASRLEFAIDPAAEAVMADERVLSMLRVKISRERIGTELEKMLKHPHAVQALRFLDRLGLYHAVFTDPERADMPRPSTSAWHVAYECLHRLEQTKTPGSIYDLLVTCEEARYYAWSMATLTPFEQLPDDVPLRSGKPAPPLATQAARGGFKATNRMCDVITAAHSNRRAILELRDVVRERREGVDARDRFGMAIRDWDARGCMWRLQVLYAILADVAERVPSGAEAEPVLAEWQAFLDHLVDLDVMNAPSLKRLVDGNMLTKALGVRGGVWTKAALDVTLAWQLRNPGVEDPAGAIEEVRKRRDELGIPRS